MLRPRVLAFAAVALLTPLLLAGCGGDDKPAAASGTPSPGAVSTLEDDPPMVDPDTGKPFKLEQPKAASTIPPTGNATRIPDTGTIYSAEDARTIRGFPVPEGAKVTDPGAAEQTWQFDIATTKPDDVLEFYKQVLPQMGFTVRTDVTYTQAYEEVHWDLVFDGRVSGSIVADRTHKTVFVVVNPPGQPAFAGDVQ